MMITVHIFAWIEWPKTLDRSRKALYLGLPQGKEMFVESLRRWLSERNHRNEYP
jgi:hypothetical protein